MGRRPNLSAHENLVTARDVALIRRIHRDRRSQGAGLLEAVEPLVVPELAPQRRDLARRRIRFRGIGGARGKSDDVSGFGATQFRWHGGPYSWRVGVSAAAQRRAARTP